MVTRSATELLQDELNKSRHSAVWDKSFDETGSEAAAAEADAKATFGFDYKRDKHGKPIEQGSGSKGNETLNHFTAIRQYEGEAAYDAAVREIFKRDPARAELIGLSKPARATP